MGLAAYEASASMQLTMKFGFFLLHALKICKENLYAQPINGVQAYMKKEKILLLNPPGDKLYIRDYYCSFSSKANYYWPPQDLIVFSGILNNDFEVHVIDAIINGIDENKCLEMISDSDFKAIIFTTGTSTLISDFAFMKAVKMKNEKIEIIASSGIMKFVGRELLNKYFFLDAVAIDFTVNNVVQYLNGDKSQPLKGLIFRNDGHLIENNDRLSDSFSIPVPRHDLFDISKYRTPTAKNLPFTVVITSLGCPYNCGFCTAGSYGYRVRETDNAIEELKYLSDLGVKEILFQDPTFTINANRVSEFCQKLIDTNLNLTWSCNADIKSLNENKVKYMKLAGCHTVSIGIESGDADILQKYAKQIDIDQIKGSIKLLNKYKYRILGYFIIGLPGENRESITKTIDFAKQLDIDIASFSIATPDIGTRLREEAIEKNWISPSTDSFDSTDYPTIETEILSKKEIWKLRNEAIRKFYLRPSYLFKQLLKTRNFRDLTTAASNAFSLLFKS